MLRHCSCGLVICESWCYGFIPEGLPVGNPFNV